MYLKSELLHNFSTVYCGTYEKNGIAHNKKDICCIFGDVLRHPGNDLR
jgi:hypothetical protein